ncbi:hypothetical protein Pse7367_3818 (plasmid) [Thalassoporum mexicanum PCC 7367]|uniref:P-loop NTPase fold protein n=1 Tax=Thalassoporum mexicanum TaxID=3457544 RepID=UPI00029FDA52|nr:P-loop NTPase fold protein [Pseudanabaena sp. PCC 7367]AFY72041.1 hypothetical protein Pse7367_3818 [Pseudanabaena sp. PCC 7367]
MKSIIDVIKSEVNPFDKHGHAKNFTRAEFDPEHNVSSIHADELLETEKVLDQVIADGQSRTIVIKGASGSGKTHFLSRVKQTLNQKAFFAYIEPYPQSDAIRKHILRYTVDSLILPPEGKQESQLMLWLKGLSVFKEKNITELLTTDIGELFLSQRKKFVKKLKDRYKHKGVYNADLFFSVLYDLTNAETYDAACEWLKGDDISEAALKELGLKESIKSENEAWKYLANFGKIADETQPIVLCFDQLESNARAIEGLSLQPLFDVNSAIHNEAWRNFLIIISLRSETWEKNKRQLHASDLARIDAGIKLKSINLDQAEDLWASRLAPLHSKIPTRPKSRIAPLKHKNLVDRIPGGKTYPRQTLSLGWELINQIKCDGGTVESDYIALFKLLWRDELRNTIARITKPNQKSSPELVRMLQQVLSTLFETNVRVPLLSRTKFSHYSLHFQPSQNPGNMGVVWTEDQNMTSFFHIMNACQKAIEKNQCQRLYLLRASKLGRPNTKGYKHYQKIFTGDRHAHIVVDMESIHYIATYYKLFNDSLAGDLVIGNKLIGLPELQDLIRQSKVFEKCSLTSQLSGLNQKAKTKTVPPPKTVTPPIPPPSPTPKMEEIDEYIQDVMKTQHMLARLTLIGKVSEEFKAISRVQIEQKVQQLGKEEKIIKIINPQAPINEQLVCFVPSYNK